MTIGEIFGAGCALFIIFLLVSCVFWRGRKGILVEFELISAIPDKEPQPRDARGRFTKG